MRKGFLLVAAAVVAAIGLEVPAAAQETPDDYADEWSNARRGDRTWEQRATEELTTGPLDRLMGPAAEEAMKPIIERIIAHIDQLYEQRLDPCIAAAVNQAHDQTIVTARKDIMRGAAEMLLSAAGGASGGGKVAEILGQTLYEQLKDQIKSRAIDAFKSQMRERMKEGLPVPFEDDNSGGGCTSEFRVIWTKSTESYEFLFAGDCNCNPVSCGKVLNFRQMPLRRWAITGSGSVIPEFSQRADGDVRVTYRASMPRNVVITADCCGTGDRPIRVHPRTGAGDEWVGFMPPPAAQPATPRRPQTGGTPQAGTGTTPAPQGTPTPQPPAGPPRTRIDIPEIPDRPLSRAELEALGERAHAAQQRAQAAHAAARTYLSELENRQPPPSADELRDAQAAVDEAGRAIGAAGRVLERVMEKFAELDAREQQQSSLPPDRDSQRLLAVHNAERAAAGVPALQWDRALQATATAYAQHLARTGRLVHSPRAGRGAERENLSQGMPGWSPEQMLRNWVIEKRNFIPGIYPNVTRTGRWQDVSHYTQMIWPTTTRVGCGMARGSGYQWLVCRYLPGGNREGQPVGTRLVL